MEAFEESVADAGACFVAGGEPEVCAMAALDRTAVRNAVIRQKRVWDMNVSYLEIGIPNGAAAPRSAEANSSRPRKFELICVKACEPLLLNPRLPTEASLAELT
jgi:hypothetical protein